MMQPMNYTINTPDTAGSFMRGANQYAQFADAQAQVQANQQKAEAQRMANERAAYQQKRFSEAVKSPDAKTVQSLMIEFPELSEQFKRSYDTLNAKEQQEATRVQYLTRSAVQAGKPELAIEEVNRMIEAAKSSGDAKNLQRLEIQRDLLMANPQAAQFTANAFLASTMGPDKFAEMMGKEGKEKREQELQPATLKEAESKADKAAVVAKFAESQEAMDLQKKGWDIKKIQNDMQVSRQNVAIAAQNSAISRANSQTARQEAEIKLQELLDKRSNTVREKVAEVESARANMDNMLNTADRILNTPMGVVGSAAGPISSRMPTMSQSTADFEALVETLGSQSFLAQIPNIKGMGALSNAEGEKLQAALQNFNLKQSPERLLENVREAQRLILKGRQNIAKRFGVPESVPDTPAAAGSGDIESLLKKYGQ